MTPQRFFDVVQRHIIIVAVAFALGVGALHMFVRTMTPNYAGVSHVLLVPEAGSQDPTVSVVDLPSIATSSVVLERVRAALDLPMALSDMKHMVSASVLGRSTIMAVTFRDPSSERAIDVSNAISEQLSKYYDEISTARYDVNLRRIARDIASVRAKLDGLNQSIGTVEAKDPFVISDRSMDDITTQLNLLAVQRASAVAQLQGDEALAATSLPSPTLSKTARHEILANDPQYRDLRTLAAKDGATLASDRAIYNPDYPGVQRGMAKFASESASAQREAQRALADPNAFSPSAADTAIRHTRELATVAGDRERLAQLDRLMTSEQAVLHETPVDGVKYAQLRAERDALQTEYTSLVSRRASALADRAAASALGNVVVLDRAIKADTQLVGARGRIVLVGLMLIVGLAVGLAFLMESLDPRLRRMADVELLYGIPVVANFGARS